MSIPEFRAWPKTPRLFKSVTVTEKIDGTNGAVIVTEDGDVFAQSRKRLLPMGPRGMDDVSWQKEDNFGFAKWVRNNAKSIAETLGAGHHCGEWWGNGIQRGYGCEPGEKYFSLFNVNKWGYLRDASPVDSLSVVPVLWEGEMDTATIRVVADELKATGSQAKPGFMKPEGVCIYHSASNQVYKYPFDKQAEPAKQTEPTVIDWDAAIREFFGLAA